MPLPEPVQREAALLLFTFCQMRAPVNIYSSYRLAVRFRANAATLYVCHGPWNAKFPKSSRSPAAQFRYDLEQQVWTLYWPDHNEHWHPCEDIAPTPDLAQLLHRIDEDPMRFFLA